MFGALFGGAAPHHDYLYFYRVDRFSTPKADAVDRGRGSHLAVAVLREPWKAVRFSPDGSREHPDEAWDFELYHLIADPAETTDVATSHPDVAARPLASMKETWVPPPYHREPWPPAGHPDQGGW